MSFSFFWFSRVKFVLLPLILRSPLVWCVFAFGMRAQPILTAGEDQRTGVFVHGEIMELQLALGVDGHPARRTETDSDKDIPTSEIALDRPVSWTVKRPDRTRQPVAGSVPFCCMKRRPYRSRWRGIRLDCTVDVRNRSKWQNCFIIVRRVFSSRWEPRGSSASESREIFLWSLNKSVQQMFLFFVFPNRKSRFGSPFKRLKNGRKSCTLQNNVQ